MPVPSTPFAHASYLVLSLLALALFTNSGSASILSSTQFEIDFTRQEEAEAKATWSDTISLNAAGLGYDADSATSRSGWIQTKPLAVGMWWRPAPSVGVRVEITPAPAPITLANGQSHTPWPGSVYVRYSADKVHWSSWHELERKDTPPGAKQDSPIATKTVIFSGPVGVPQRERETYVRYLEAYAALDVPWASDEEAAARWIVTREPDFFARTIPFIGYVEFLFEKGFHGGQRVTSLNANVGFGISGLSAIPRDREAERMNDPSPWRFVGQESSPAKSESP